MNDTITKEQAKSAVRILSRRFRKPPKKRKTRVENLHPVIDFLFDEMSHLKMTDAEMQAKVKLSCNVLGNWRRGNGPTLAKLETVLNAIGYTVVAVPMPETTNKGD